MMMNVPHDRLAHQKLIADTWQGMMVLMDQFQQPSQKACLACHLTLQYVGLLFYMFMIYRFAQNFLDLHFRKVEVWCYRVLMIRILISPQLYAAGCGWVVLCGGQLLSRSRCYSSCFFRHHVCTPGGC